MRALRTYIVAIFLFNLGVLPMSSAKLAVSAQHHADSLDTASRAAARQDAHPEAATNPGQNDAQNAQQGARQMDTSAIRTILTHQQEAWNRGDVDAFLVGYWHSPDLTFSGTGGISRGWDSVLARYKKNYPDRAAMGTLDFSDLEFHFLGSDAALVLGHWHLKRQNGDIGGVFSLVCERFPEGWRIIHDHTSAAAK